MPKPKAIPDRWLPYSCMGSVIPGTRIICFKVPLKTAVLEAQIANGQRIEEIWDIQTLLKRVPKLRFVIDLTNTNRYYDPRMLENAGVQYVKIAMPGRVIPPEKVVNTFSDAVEQFLGSSDDDALVGVHCTHGLNRTGYMVCRYLRDRLNMPPQQAIEIFEAARGYKIERDNYLADILGREGPPPDFGKITVLKPVETASNPDNGPRYGRQWEDRISREGYLTTGLNPDNGPRYGRLWEDRSGREGYLATGPNPYNGPSYGRLWENRSSRESYSATAPNPDNGQRYGRQREDRPSREGSSGWRGRGRTGRGDRERSPIRNRREQERNGEEKMGSGHKTDTRAARFRRYSNSGGSNDYNREYDFRYDY